MAPKSGQSSHMEAWTMARRQHGVITRGQLLDLGFSSDAIRHRLATGRLHRVWDGVYAVGRPELTDLGRFMAAVLSCGPSAALSHRCAATVWGFGAWGGGRIDVSVPAPRNPRRRSIAVHRRAGLTAEDVTVRHRIPVTGPVCTLIDLATVVDRDRLEAAVNEADKLDLVDPEALRSALQTMGRRTGAGVLRGILDSRTFTLTDSALERRFLPLVRSAGLGQPETGRRLNGYRVDFYWRDLGLVVETDGLRYHRTAAQQEADRLRDQAHTAAGLTCLRFTHSQVARDPGQVRTTLTAVARSLRG